MCAERPRPINPTVPCPVFRFPPKHMIPAKYVMFMQLRLELCGASHQRTWASPSSLGLASPAVPPPEQHDSGKTGSATARTRRRPPSPLRAQGTVLGRRVLQVVEVPNLQNRTTARASLASSRPQSQWGADAHKVHTGLCSPLALRSLRTHRVRSRPLPCPNLPNRTEPEPDGRPLET